MSLADAGGVRAAMQEMGVRLVLTPRLVPHRDAGEMVITGFVESPPAIAFRRLRAVPDRLQVTCRGRRGGWEATAQVWFRICQIQTTAPPAGCQHETLVQTGPLDLADPASSLCDLLAGLQNALLARVVAADADPEARCLVALRERLLPADE